MRVPCGPQTSRDGVNICHRKAAIAAAREDFSVHLVRNPGEQICFVMAVVMVDGRLISFRSVSWRLSVPRIDQE